MVMERFYETAIDEIPRGDNLPGALFYRLFHAHDYSLIRYSLGHFADFVRGMQQLIKAFDRPGCPALLNTLLQRAARLLEHEAIQSLAKTERGLKFNPVQVIYYGWHIRERFKNQALELIEIYGSLDAWYSMAMATVNTNSASPNSCNRKIQRRGPRALSYFTAGARVLRCATEPPDELSLSYRRQYGGKSTFIRAVGTAVFLAHLGMGVPASRCG